MLNKGPVVGFLLTFLASPNLSSFTIKYDFEAFGK